MAIRNKLNLDNEYGKKAYDLWSKGYSDGYITKELNDIGLKIHHSTVSKFLGKLRSENNSQFSPSKNILIIENEYEDSKLSLDKFIKELDLSDNLDNQSILENANKLINKTFLLTSLILVSKLDDFSNGKCKYPREMFRCYEIALNALSLAHGIRSKPNIKRAIDVYQELENDSNFDITDLIVE